MKMRSTRQFRTSHIGSGNVESALVVGKVVFVVVIVGKALGYTGFVVASSAAGEGLAWS